MKRLLTTMTLTLGLILFAMPAFTDQTETSGQVDAQHAEIGTNATQACPDCSGIAYTITGVVFENGMNCICTGTVSLTVGAGTTVRSGATVAFKAPAVSVVSGATFEAGSSVRLIPGFYPLTVTAAANPASIPADGSTYSLITATLVDSDGQPWPQGTSVTFTTNLGKFGNGTQTQTETLNSQGKAAVALRGTTAGTATVTATSWGVAGQEPVTFYASGANNVTVNAVPSSLAADGTSTSTITAVVTDGGGSSVADGTKITFTVENGTFGGSKSAIATTVNGNATVTYTASVTPNPINTITATTETGIIGTTNIVLTGPQIATVTLTANPEGLPADGASTSTISATVTISGGGSAPDGTQVNFSITSGGGGSITGSDTTTGGIAYAKLTSGTTAETITIQAAAGGITGELDVEFTPGSVSLVINPNSVLGTGDKTAAVTVTLKNADGTAPVNDETVYFFLSDVSLGQIAESVVVPAGVGEAQVQFEALTKGGTATITGMWETGGIQVKGEVTISIQSPPASLEITQGYPSPQQVNIRGTGGQSTSELRFNVRDLEGQLVDDGYRIDFSVVTGPNGGENLIPASAKTVNGQVTTLLYSGLKSGPVSIKATYHQNTTVSTSTSHIVIVGGPPVGEEFGISAQYVNISGLSVAGLSDPVTVNAADQYGNAIPDNTAISFKTYNTGGYFATGTATTVNGVASDKLMSGGTALSPINGFLSITGEVVGGKTTRVSAIEVVPSPDNHIVYAGTNGGGVYKSMDAGATWENISRSTDNPKAGQNWIDPYIKGNSAISVDPDDHNVVYVGTGYLGAGSLFRTKDGGMNWNSNNLEEWNGLLSLNAAVLTVLCDGNGSDYVWIGTEGKGAFYAADGETFVVGGQVAPTVPTQETAPGLFDNPVDTGDGKMTQPTLSPTSQSEDWTVTYIVPNASASTPQAVAGNAGNGIMSMVITDRYATKTETWTVKCITTAAGPTSTWQVSGTTSGIQAATATNGVLYTSDNSEVSFTIYDGATDFAVGDQFTFSTTAGSPYWQVTGDVSGTQGDRAQNNLLYSSDNEEISFLITEGGTPFVAGDEFTFQVTESGLGHGRMVRDIVKAPGTNGGTAVLYAATSTGIFRSANGGKLWSETTAFTDDNINTMAIHPLSNGITDILYAGTENAGVWVSTDSGTSWTQYYPDGMGKGLSASVPEPNVDNEGNGLLGSVTVFENTLSELWTVTCTNATAPATFDAEGSVSGVQTNKATVGTTYTSDTPAKVSFKISAGSIPFQVGDSFEFTTTRNSSKTIKDLLVDSVNNRLYALTYFFGPLEPFHAVGNIYSHALNPDGSMGAGNWVEATTGLPTYAPPNDLTLYAQNAIAMDNPANPAWFLVGGEGINMYKATSGNGGFPTGSPVWKTSKSGLNNLLMARRPMLFSNFCTMTVKEVIENPASPNDKLFKVYIQDENGNPPVSGSTFTVRTYDAFGIIFPPILDKTYSDTLAGMGTFGNPSDPNTNNPYEFEITVSPGSTVINQVVKVEFIFIPECSSVIPGCSGALQTRVFSY